MTARCGRRLDVFDWGHGGAGRRRYWTLSKRLTILKIYSVTGHGLCQKGSQYDAIDREGTTIRDFTPQDPFPGVSIDQPITFNQHPKNIYVIYLLSNVSRGKSWVRVGSTDLRDAPNNCHRQIN